MAWGRDNHEHLTADQLASRPPLVRGNRAVRTSDPVLLQCGVSDTLACYLYDPTTATGWWVNIFNLSLVPCHTVWQWHKLDSEYAKQHLPAAIMFGCPMSKGIPKRAPFPV